MGSHSSPVIKVEWGIKLITVTETITESVHVKYILDETLKNFY